MAEVHGPTHDDARAQRTELLFGARAEIGEQERHQIDERVSASEDAGRLEASVREVRLERLDEPSSSFGLEVAIDRARACDGLEPPVLVAVVGVEIEYRSERVREACPVGESRELHLATIGDAERAVGGSEIESDSSHLARRLGYPSDLERSPEVGTPATAWVPPSSTSLRAVRARNITSTSPTGMLVRSAMSRTEE